MHTLSLSCCQLLKWVIKQMNSSSASSVTWYLYTIVCVPCFLFVAGWCPELLIVWLLLEGGGWHLIKEIRYAIAGHIPLSLGWLDSPHDCVSKGTCQYNKHALGQWCTCQSATQGNNRFLYTSLFQKLYSDMQHCDLYVQSELPLFF